VYIRANTRHITGNLVGPYATIAARCDTAQQTHSLQQASFGWHNDNIARAVVFVVSAMAEKCHRTGKVVYAMDQPVRMGGLVFSKAGFTCAATGTKLTLHNAIIYDGDVYHKDHVPRDTPISSGIDLNTEHLMASQGTSSSAHTKGRGYTGTETSGFSHVPEHVSQAKAAGSGFSGTRSI